MSDTRVHRRRGSSLGRLWRQPTGRFGLIVVGVIVLTAAVSLVWTPFDPQRVDLGDRWAAPGWPHLFGTDNTGRDILSMIMAGARTTGRTLFTVDLDWNLPIPTFTDPVCFLVKGLPQGFIGEIKDRMERNARVSSMKPDVR